MTKEKVFVEQKDALHRAVAMLVDLQVKNKYELATAFNKNAKTVAHWINRGRMLNGFYEKPTVEKGTNEKEI